MKKVFQSCNMEKNSQRKGKHIYLSTFRECLDCLTCILQSHSFSAWKTTVPPDPKQVFLGVKEFSLLKTPLLSCCLKLSNGSHAECKVCLHQCWLESAWNWVCHHQPWQLHVTVTKQLEKSSLINSQPCKRHLSLLVCLFVSLPVSLSKQNKW